jgi:hypothetical protein
MNSWQYPASLGQERINRLQSETSLDAIVERIEREMSVLCFHLQPCDDDTAYARPVFCVQVTSQLFDAFFNSPAGYRGAYYASPFSGLEANHLLITRLLPRLVAHAETTSPGFDSSFSFASFTATSAKAWLAERSLELCKNCEGEWRHPNDDVWEIQNERWERTNSPNSKKGRKAPFHSKIRLFGAFLNSKWDEFVPAHKRRRAFDINETGWAWTPIPMDSPSIFAS